MLWRQSDVPDRTASRWALAPRNLLLAIGYLRFCYCGRDLVL